MNRRVLFPLFAAAALLASAAGAGCQAECSSDGGCEEVAGDELPLQPTGGPCATSTQCSAGDGCYKQRCTNVELVPDPATCPPEPLSDELVCSAWDKDACPCFAGVVSLHEKDEGGRLSCAGIAGRFSERVYLKQSGCHLAALDDQLTGDAIGFGELKLDIPEISESSCSAQPDRWIPEGATEGRPATRITCSATCKFWMEQLPAAPQERVVPDGSFAMGTAPDVLPLDRPDEGPEHLVEVSCFYMDRFEVSRGQYQQCLAVGTCSHPDYAAAGEGPAEFFAESSQQLPMTFVTHAQADAFCKFYEKSLPTEAEWERAARANRWSMATYPWGAAPPFDTDGPDCETANFAGCGDQVRPVDDGGGDSVRERGVSYFDLADLGGNVAEWTRDYYTEDAYQLRAASSGSGGAKDPEQLRPGPDGEVRVIRGGSFRSTVLPEVEPPQDDLRTSARRFAQERTARDDLGFRCVRYKPGVMR